jgi:hypothetical protein
MVSDPLKRVLIKFAVALMSEKVPERHVGYTGTGVRQSRLRDPGGDPEQVWAVFEQNPALTSTGAARAREGHKVVLFRDEKQWGLLGSYDVCCEKFISFECEVPGCRDRNVQQHHILYEYHKGRPKIIPLCSKHHEVITETQTNATREQGYAPLSEEQREWFANQLLAGKLE